MPKKRLYWMFVALFVIHGLEEWRERVYNNDLGMIWISHLLHVSPQIIYVLIELLWIGAMIAVGITPRHWFYRYSPWFLGLIAVIESQHVFLTIYLHQYYPGTISAIAVIFLATWMIVLPHISGRRSGI